jgi:hypothetical protein
MIEDVAATVNRALWAQTRGDGLPVDFLANSQSAKDIRPERPLLSAQAEGLGNIASRESSLKGSFGSVS